VSYPLPLPSSFLTGSTTLAAPTLLDSNAARRLRPLPSSQAHAGSSLPLFPGGASPSLPSSSAMPVIPPRLPSWRRLLPRWREELRPLPSNRQQRQGGAARGLQRRRHHRCEGEKSRGSSNACLTQVSAGRRSGCGGCPRPMSCRCHGGTDLRFFR
jgi:hypothetical protein